MLKWLSVPQSKKLTDAVQNHQTRHHEDGVPVKLQVRSIPGEAALPHAAPAADKQQAEQPQTQAQREGPVERPRRPHVYKTGMEIKQAVAHSGKIC